MSGFRWTNTLRAPLPVLAQGRKWLRVDEDRRGWLLLAPSRTPADGPRWYRGYETTRTLEPLSVLEDPWLDPIRAVIRRCRRRGSKVEILAWRVGKRAVLRVGSASGRVVYRVYRRDRRILDRWTGLPTGRGEPVSVPLVLDWDPEHRVLQTDWRHGVSLNERWIAGKGQGADGKRIVEVLTWLAAGRIPSGFPRYGRENEVRMLQRRLEAFERTLADPLPRARELTSRVIRSLRDDPPLPPVLSHGDLHDKHLLLEGPSVSLIDLDAAAASPPARDPANLLAHLRLRALQGAPVPWASIARRVHAGCVGPRGIEESLHRWTAASLLRLALIYARRRRSEVLIGDLLSSAEQALDRRAEWRVFS